MAERLGRIAPAPAVSSGHTSTAEEIATDWLLGDRPRMLIPPSLLGQLADSISRLLPMPADSMGMPRHGQAS